MNSLLGFTTKITNYLHLISQSVNLYNFKCLKTFPIFILLFLFLISCAPEKQEITDLDVHKIIERVSYSRFTERLDLEDSTKIKSDRELFLDACEIYRINPKVILDKLKNTNPSLYQRFKDENEK